MSQSNCSVRGAELVELERWTFSVEDMEAKAHADLGRGLTVSERQRFEQYVGEGSLWREVTCPRNPLHIDLLFERVEFLSDHPDASQ